MKTRITTICYLLSAIFELAFAQGTAFTYQGRLNDGASPATGIYDLRFAIYDAASAGTLIAGPFTNSATGITNGLLTVTLNFGSIFTGTNYWLDIGVRTNSTGTFVGLAPRQPVTPTPYAIFANTASNLSGTVANSALPSSPNFSGTVTAASFTGSGTNLTSLNANNISSGTLADARLSANVALRAGGNTFTETQIFNGPIYLNTTNGFDQSSVGNFYIDAPFIPGGRLAVLENGNVGVGNPNPLFTLDVNGDMNLPLPATIYATYIGTSYSLLHADANANVFAGLSAGNLTLSGPYNVGIGYSALTNDTSGSYNTAVGTKALYVNTIGFGNTAAGANTLYSNTNGYDNTASGMDALFSNTSGFFNTANGADALDFNTSGDYNTASGAEALYSNTTGDNNTASGFDALYANTIGINNTANGYQALYSDTDGSWNTANGYQALYSNISGGDNTADGAEALYSNVSGADNTACGNNALHENSTGSDNTAVGNAALNDNTAGGFNTAIGDSALTFNTNGSYNVAAGTGALGFSGSGSYNTAVGENALEFDSSGSRNIALGEQAGLNITRGNDNIDVGNFGVEGDNNTIRIGTQGTQTNAFIAGIAGTPVSGSAVVVNSSGQLGVAPSSQRFKQNIQNMGVASDVLLALQPVTFQYKPAIDPQGIPQFGLIAEQVEKVDPDLVVHDQKHGIYTVRYEAVSAMLLNEFLKEHRKVEEQEAEIQSLKQTVNDLRGIMNQLTARKGSAQ